MACPFAYAALTPLPPESADPMLASSSSSCSLASSDSALGPLSSSGIEDDGSHPAFPCPQRAPGVHQAWTLKRPGVDAGAVRLTRRQLRRLDRAWTLAEVARHNTATDAWIAVGGRVYDITEHLASHPGWEGAGVTTVLSILAHAGSECTAEFEEIHRPWPVAWRQLAAFDIGPLLAERGR